MEREFLKQRNSSRREGGRERIRDAVLFSLFFALSIWLLAPGVAQADQVDDMGYRTTITVPDGKDIDAIIVPGIPPAIKGEAVNVPEPQIDNAVRTLLSIPAFDWSFGCAATSAAMIAGYYDNNGYPEMYTGPTDDGVMPMDNSSWGSWVDGSGATRKQCPLSATRNGLDGRSGLGHVDDFWVQYGNDGDDPYVGNWTRHEDGDCTGDFMGTNQSALGNSDGSTMFYYYPDGSPLYDFDAENNPQTEGTRDGCWGFANFLESRGGYQVVSNYNQYIYGHKGNTKGFTFEQYKQEIDANRPVLIHVTGHAMVGFGYDDSTQTVYLHDTWDYNSHSMVWGGSYEGMDHLAVSVFDIGDIAGPAPGNALDFDGTNDYVTCGDFMPATYTKEAWVKRGAGDAINNIVSGGESDGRHAFLAPYIYSYHLSAGHNGTWNAVEDSAALPQDVWVHVAVSYDSSSLEMILYKNGMEVDRGTVASFDSGDAVRIGSYSDTANLFAGQIDEVRIWSDVRTIDEIRANMCRTLDGDEAGLLAYYSFDNAAGSVLTDLAGDNDGTLHNMTDSDWVASGASMGDDAEYDYSGTSDAPETFAANVIGDNGDAVTAQGDGGSDWVAIQVYYINQGPNDTDPPAGIQKLSPTCHMGVKAIGDTDPTYTIVYNYDGHPGIQDENYLDLCYRHDAGSAWQRAYADLDTEANTLTLTGQSGTEYILAGVDSPTLIELASFTAAVYPDRVALDWETASEIDNAGFRLWRSESVNGDYARIDDEMIAAKGDEVTGAAYSYEDSVDNGAKYFYRLEDIDYSGESTFHALTARVMVLEPGWNVVAGDVFDGRSVSGALSSIAGKYDSVWGLQDGTWKSLTPDNPGLSDLDYFAAGSDYWIYAREACLVTLP